MAKAPTVAEKRGGGAGFLWFLAGVLVGAVGALVLSGVMDRREPARPEVAESGPALRPAVEAPKPKARPVAPPAASASPAKPKAEALDPQVAEDAAAVGMTTRTRAPAPAGQQ